MITVVNENKAVQIKREFYSLQAFDDTKLLKVQYKEVVEIDGEVVKEEIKHYERDYDFWKASELGVAIISMIELDLEQNEPSAPRN